MPNGRLTFIRTTTKAPNEPKTPRIISTFAASFIFVTIFSNNENPP